MCRRKIENRDQLLADVDTYIRDHAPISLEELVQAMQELGHDCTPRMVRPHLKERGLTVKSINGRWLWGMWDEESERETSRSPSIRTIKQSLIVESACSSSSNHDDVDEDDDDDDDDVDERPDPEPLKKAEAENARLQAENNKLIVALLKTTQLKKSIRAMQEKLLVELADLIIATYGERESEKMDDGLE